MINPKHVLHLAMKELRVLWQHKGSMLIVYGIVFVIGLLLNTMVPLAILGHNTAPALNAGHDVTTAVLNNTDLTTVDDTDTFNQSLTYFAGNGKLTTGDVLYKWYPVAGIGLQLMFISMISVLLSNLIIIREKDKQIFEPLLSTPITVQDIVLGKALAITLASAGANALFTLIQWAIVDIICGPVLPNLACVYGVFVFAPLIVMLSICIETALMLYLKDSNYAYLLLMIFNPGYIFTFAYIRGDFPVLNLVINPIGAILLTMAIILVLILVRAFFNRERILARLSK